MEGRGVESPPNHALLLAMRKTTLTTVYGQDVLAVVREEISSPSVGFALPWRLFLFLWKLKGIF